jgi:glyoxylase-like metal-dependent hydrolase (beta-lactamase superfamily II)
MKNIILILLSIAFCTAQRDFSNVTVSVTKASDHIYMMTGAGGNIGVSIGDDDVLIVDSQFAPLHEKIVAAIKNLSNKPVGFLINTHFHGDHTGGNEAFGMEKVTIVAHENVRTRLQTNQTTAYFNSKTPASKAIAQPVITFNQAVNIHINGDDIHVIHVPNAHTDGDGIVFFKQSNVIHMGDTYFAGMYPFIDVSNGGSIEGVIEAQEKALQLANEKTTIIPGHGPMQTMADLAANVVMLRSIKDQIKKAKKAGKSLSDIHAMEVTKAFDATYNNGFIKSKDFVTFVFESL